MRRFVLAWLACPPACAVAPSDVDADGDGVDRRRRRLRRRRRRRRPATTEVAVRRRRPRLRPRHARRRRRRRRLATSCGGDCDDAGPAPPSARAATRSPTTGSTRTATATTSSTSTATATPAAPRATTATTATRTHTPRGVEVCDDGIDQDCDRRRRGLHRRSTRDGDGSPRSTGDCDDDDRARSTRARPRSPTTASTRTATRPPPTTTTTATAAQRAPATATTTDDAGVHPGAVEIPYDGIDQDCDGADLVDVDGDGARRRADGDDCDDRDPRVHPGARRGLPRRRRPGLRRPTADADADGDGHDAPLLGGDDCDDFDAAVHPGAARSPYDGVDDDCDGHARRRPRRGRLRAGRRLRRRRRDASPRRAAEVAYDGIDQDCDGADLVDVDGDGFAGGTLRARLRGRRPRPEPRRHRGALRRGRPGLRRHRPLPVDPLPEAACGPVEARYLSSADGVTLVVGVCRSEAAWSDTLVGLLVDDDGTSGDWFDILGPARVTAPRVTWDGASFVVLGLLERLWHVRRRDGRPRLPPGRRGRARRARHP